MIFKLSFQAGLANACVSDLFCQNLLFPREVTQLNEARILLTIQIVQGLLRHLDLAGLAGEFPFQLLYPPLDLDLLVLSLMGYLLTEVLQLLLLDGKLGAILICPQLDLIILALEGGYLLVQALQLSRCLFEPGQ